MLFGLMNSFVVMPDLGPGVQCQDFGLGLGHGTRILKHVTFLVVVRLHLPKLVSCDFI